MNLIRSDDVPADGLSRLDVWREYESAKRLLQKFELSPAEYEQAIKRLAETLGI